jgi:hypothetical protein
MDASFLNAALASAGAATLFMLILWPKLAKPAITEAQAQPTPPQPQQKNMKLLETIGRHALGHSSEFTYLAGDSCPIQYDSPPVLGEPGVKSPLYGSGRYRSLSGGDGYLPVSYM